MLLSDGIGKLNIHRQTTMYWRFVKGLKEFLREPISPQVARQALTEALQNRERNFLNRAREAIYERVNSPYLKLLRLAGCEYGDLEKLVRSEGIEPTLDKLHQAGVYVTLEEFKGRQPITRGNVSFEAREDDFDAPLGPGVISSDSGGSRGAGTRTSYDFDTLAIYAMHRSIMAAADDADAIRLALWWPTLPGGGTKQLLMCTKAGRTPVRWFAQVSRAGSGPSLKDRMLTNYVVCAGRLLGTKWPAPEYTPPGQAARA